jgi:hypothetical protein
VGDRGGGSVFVAPSILVGCIGSSMKHA